MAKPVQAPGRGRARDRKRSNFSMPKGHDCMEHESVLMMHVPGVHFLDVIAARMVKIYVMVFATCVWFGAFE